MLYPGDPVLITLDVTQLVPVGIQVSTPQLVIYNAMTNQPVVSPAVPMVQSAANPMVYYYVWSTVGRQDGWYMAFASWTAGQATYTNVLVQTIKLGDSRILDIVARESVVAKEVTTAKAADVLTKQDFQTEVAPPIGMTGKLGELVGAIKTIVDRIPNQPAAASDIAALQQKVNEVYEYCFGRWELDKATGEMRFYRRDSTLITSLQTGVSGNVSFRG